MTAVMPHLLLSLVTVVLFTSSALAANNEGQSQYFLMPSPHPTLNCMTPYPTLNCPLIRP